MTQTLLLPTLAALAYSVKWLFTFEQKPRSLPAIPQEEAQRKGARP